MFSDKRIREKFNNLVDAIQVPPHRYEDIVRRAQSEPPRAKRPRFIRPVLAAAACIAVGMLMFPTASSAFVQSLQAINRAALVALGGIAPPPAPKSFVSALEPHTMTLAQAQARATFTIVPPEGLPADTQTTKIEVGPTGVYDARTHRWKRGTAEIVFAVHRPGGRVFYALAQRFDARSEMPKFVFDADSPLVHGRPALKKYENFAWRNGDQQMSIVEGHGVTAAEILAIERAMRGIPVPLRALHAPSHGNAVLHIIRP